MTTWKEKAEAFAVRRRELSRQGKLSEEAENAASYLGSLMGRLEHNPDLIDELQPLFKAFNTALNDSGGK